MHTPSSAAYRNFRCIFAGIGLLLLSHCSPQPAADNADTKTDTLVNQIFASLDQDATVKKCNQKEDAGQYKSHADGYLHCCKPRVILAFRNAGVTDRHTLHLISEKFYEAQRNRDKGVTETRKDLKERVKEILEHQATAQ